MEATWVFQFVQSIILLMILWYVRKLVDKE